MKYLPFFNSFTIAFTIFSPLFSPKLDSMQPEIQRQTCAWTEGSGGNAAQRTGFLEAQGEWGKFLILFFFFPAFSHSRVLRQFLHINSLKKKKHTLIRIGTEKAPDEIQRLFITKILRKLGIEGNSLNLKRASIETPTGNLTLNGERLNNF